MSFLRRLLTTLRPPRARYGEEVLLAGWVQLPRTVWDLIRGDLIRGELIRRR